MHEYYSLDILSMSVEYFNQKLEYFNQKLEYFNQKLEYFYQKKRAFAIKFFISSFRFRLFFLFQNRRTTNHFCLRRMYKFLQH